MFSTILSHLRSNRRYMEIAANLGSKYSKRFISLNFESINRRNCIKTNPYFGYNPLIIDIVSNDYINRKTDPILDKLHSNMRYILLNESLKSPVNQINPILLPDLMTLRDVDQNKRRITDSESKTKVIEEPPTKVNQMYCDYRIIRDPRSYTHLTIIRRKKMNKHKRIKWRKKMLSFIKRKFLKRNIKTEKLFRAELLAQIKEAEEFDAEKYVRTILETIDSVPKPETREQRIEKIKDLVRKNRRETNLIPPKFDD